MTQRGEGGLAEAEEAIPKAGTEVESSVLVCTLSRVSDLLAALSLV